MRAAGGRADGRASWLVEQPAFTARWRHVHWGGDLGLGFVATRHRTLRIARVDETRSSFSVFALVA
jgi:hypothetical protein